MQNISGFGLSGRLTASATFPSGFQITEWADDADPLDSPDLVLAETGMGLNGHMVTWSKPGGIEITLGVIPSSESDTNLDVLAQANRVANGKRGARDVINIVLTYPSGDVVTMATGVITSAPMASPVQSSGRMKSHMYKFVFEQVSKVKA